MAKKVSGLRRRGLGLDKRAKFVLGTIFLTLVFLWGNLTPGPFWQQTLFLGLFCALIVVFVLRREITGPKFFWLLILPVFFTVFSFCFVKKVTLPASFKASSPLFFGLGIYIIFLITNIFNICLMRKIPLFRAALAAGFLFTVIAALLGFSLLFFLRLSFWQNALGVVFISWPLIFQALWAVDPKQGTGKKPWRVSLVSALVLGELALAISFWPVVFSLGALFLASVLYALVGIGQLYLSDRLNKQRLLEYGSIAIIVLILMTLSAQWG